MKPRRSSPPAIAIFARRPVAGKAKTRLIPLLGARGAAQLQAALLFDTLRKVDSLPRRVARHLFVAGGGAKLASTARGAGDARALKRFRVTRQAGRDLGERLERAFRSLLQRHSKVVIIGTDSPELPSRLLDAALGELRFADAVLGPCPDGGFYLLGLKCFEGRLPAGLLNGVRWGTRFALRDSLQNLLARGLMCSRLEPIADIDRPADLRRLRKTFLRHPSIGRQAPATWRFVKEYVG